VPRPEAIRSNKGERRTWYCGTEQSDRILCHFERHAIRLNDPNAVNQIQENSPVGTHDIAAESRLGGKLSNRMLCTSSRPHDTNPSRTGSLHCSNGSL
jgi:hypothetical protein